MWKRNCGPKSSLSAEHAYIDAMHSRVNGYKIVTMWTFHPGMNKVVNLAIMDCHKENTEMLTLFLELFNSSLQDLTGNSQYKFNPIGIMCDESGANMNAIERVFGKDFMARVVTCQWHFCQCAKCQLPEINTLERETFTKMVNDLCYSSTVNDYERITNILHNICSQNGLENWWTWWDEQCFHIVPAFHGFGIIGLNLAETGHSSLHVNKKLWLSAAAWRDVCFYIIQDSEYQGFINNTTKSSGKGPNLLQCKQKRDQTGRDFMKSCKRKLEDGSVDLQKEIYPEADQSQYFIPNKKAKHHVPKTFSTSNPSQKRKKTQVTQQKKKVIKVDTSDGESSEDEVTNQKSVVPSEKERQKLLTNPLQIVFITKQVQKSSGCKEYFDKEDCKQPKDMVFMTRMHRDIPVKQKGQDKPKWVKNLKCTPAYFHMCDFACLNEVDELKQHKLKKKDLYFKNSVYSDLFKGNIKFLKDLKYWEAIVQNRATVLSN